MILSPLVLVGTNQPVVLWSSLRYCLATRLHIGGRHLLDFLRKGHVQSPVADRDPFVELAGDRRGPVALVGVGREILLFDPGNFRGRHPVALDLGDLLPAAPVSDLLMRRARREGRVQRCAATVSMQVSVPASAAQRQSLVDQRAIQPRALARTQDRVEHLERRLVRVAAVRHLVRDHHRAELAGRVTMTRRGPVCAGSSV